MLVSHVSMGYLVCGVWRTGLRWQVHTNGNVAVWPKGRRACLVPWQSDSLASLTRLEYFRLSARQPRLFGNAMLPGRSVGAEAKDQVMAALASALHVLICIDARQNLATPGLRSETVLVPQRKPFGLCGALPSLLSVTAWSDGTARDFIAAASSEDMSTNFSLINSFTMGYDPAPLLKTCSGALWGLFVLVCSASSI